MNYFSRSGEENYVLFSTWEEETRSYAISKVNVSELQKHLPSSTMIINKKFIKNDDTIVEDSDLIKEADKELSNVEKIKSALSTKISKVKK
jgi:hypothetical protein